MICTKCRTDRPIDDFKRRKNRRRDRVCRYCKSRATQRQNYWRLHGRKCKRCGKTKPCPSEITAVDRSDTGICKVCIKAKATVRTTKWARVKRATDDEWRQRQIAAARRWQAKNPDQVRRNNQKRFERIKADPKRHELLKMDQRMRYRLRMERAGTPIKPLSERTYLRKYGHGYGRATTLPAAPLKELLEFALESVDEKALADTIGIAPRRIFEIRHARQEMISLVNADKICTALGVPLGFVYADAA